MREILFRAKRTDNGEWVYGFYFCMYHDDDREHLHHFIIPLNVSIPKDRPIGEIQVEVDPDTVGQCVSDLPDKNGKKIFEGDIISVPGSKKPGLPGIVIFHQLDAKYILFRQRYSYLNLINVNEWGYVIGNIHDNPELLEDKP